MLHQCCTCCSALVVLLEEIPNICLWVKVKIAAQPQNGLLCSVQAPAPVAFPMTTPQVPVYGMVKRTVGTDPLIPCWDQSIINLIILSLFTWSCLFLTFCPGGLPALTCPPTSSPLKWVIRWGAFPWCPRSLLCTTSQSWDLPIPLGPYRGHR